MTTPPLPRSVAVLFFSFMAASALPGADSLTVTVANDPAIARPAATIEVPWKEIIARMPEALPDHLRVKGPGGEELPSQFTNFHPEKRPAEYDALLFQQEFAEGEKSAQFVIEKTEKPVPPSPSKVFARYVPERLDDFAWENDRMAHRMYGPALDSDAAGKSRLASSGIDLWPKRVSHLIVDRWYLRGHDAYHVDQGEGIDLYVVGGSRGCGGTGIWKDGKLYVSGNWSSWKVLANGPIRAVFELGYKPWDAGGIQVSETKRFTVDAGSNLDRVESTFDLSDPEAEVTVAIGLGKKSKDVASEELTARPAEGWMGLWQKYKEHGALGCGVVLEAAPALAAVEDEKNHLLLTRARHGEPVRYYVGAGWDRAGRFTSSAEWNDYLAAFRKRVESPVKIVKIEPEAAAAASAEKRTPMEWSRLMADSEMKRMGNSLFHETPKAKWTYTTGLLGEAYLKLAAATGEEKYAEFGAKCAESFIQQDGTISRYKVEDYNIDLITPGKILLLRWANGHRPEANRKAIETLRRQMREHPRTSEGGFWHKKRYPHQMWLDGLYMASPFLAQYGKMFDEPALFDEVVKQLTLVDKYTYNPEKGLHHHGWDEAKQQPWANKETGRSPGFWARAVGWYAMALVDSLDFLPADHPGVPKVREILTRVADGIVRYQDPKTGLWYQVPDQGDREGNYLEGTASAMFVYSLIKAVHHGWLPREKYLPVALKGYEGILTRLIRTDESGAIHLTQCCAVAGLGGDNVAGSRPRDGTFEYYISEPIVENDHKGVGPFILTGIELTAMGPTGSGDFSRRQENATKVAAPSKGD